MYVKPQAFALATYIERKCSGCVPGVTSCGKTPNCSWVTTHDCLWRHHTPSKLLGKCFEFVCARGELWITTKCRPLRCHCVPGCQLIMTQRHLVCYCWLFYQNVSLLCDVRMTAKKQNQQCAETQSLSVSHVCFVWKEGSGEKSWEDKQ